MAHNRRDRCGTHSLCVGHKVLLFSTKTSNQGEATTNKSTMNPEISPPARVAATPPHQAQQHQHRLNHTRALREERGGGERSAGTNTPTMAQAQTSSPTRRTPAALDAGSTTASASGRTQPDLQHYGGSGLPHLATGNSTVWNSTTGAFLVSDAVGMQRLSLDKAVAPLLKAPVAPFAKKNERKRALLNASYYSECFLNSIGPLDADSAALDAQHRYDKWWVEAKYRGGGGEDGGDGDGDSSSVPGTKKRRVSSSDTSNSPIEPAEGRTSLAADEERKCERRTGPCVIVDDDQSLSSLLPQSLKNPPNVVTNDPSLPLKAALVADLQATGGDVTTPVVLSCLGQLHALYCERMCDARWSRRSETFDGDGTWLTLSKPTFSECLGRNAQGRNLYTLGRLSFDMFRPTQLKCSVNGIFNSVSLASANSDDDEAARPRSYPRRFQKTLQSSSGKDNSPAVRNYEYVCGWLTCQLVRRPSCCDLILTHSTPVFVDAASRWRSRSRPIKHVVAAQWKASKPTTKSTLSGNPSAAF